MRPRVCPACSKALGRETRHKASRLCAQVQAERRREADPSRKAYHAKRMKRLRLAIRRVEIDGAKLARAKLREMIEDMGIGLSQEGR